VEVDEDCCRAEDDEHLVARDDLCGKVAVVVVALRDDIDDDGGVRWKASTHVSEE